MPVPLDQFEVPKKKQNLANVLTDATVATEGLIPGQTPLRMPADKSKAYKNSVQGVKLDWSAHQAAPKSRQNFYFVAPGQEKKVIKTQWQKYFNTPAKYGLTHESTIADAVKKFDQENPRNKLKFLEQNNIDPRTKIKDARSMYDLSFLSNILDGAPDGQSFG